MQEIVHFFDKVLDIVSYAIYFLSIFSSKADVLFL
jgi:hypothetical protein